MRGLVRREVPPLAVARGQRCRDAAVLDVRGRDLGPAGLLDRAVALLVAESVLGLGAVDKRSGIGEVRSRVERCTYVVLTSNYSDGAQKRYG